jgi:hypothetical protein
MADSTTTIAIAHEINFLQAPLIKIVGVNYSGTLKSAVLKGSFSGTTLYAIGNFVVIVNGEQVASLPVSAVGGFSPSFNVDISQWLYSAGQNDNFSFTWNGFPINPSITGVSISADLDVTVSGGTVQPPPPPTSTNLTQIAEALIVLIVVAVAAGLFLRAKG